MLAWHPGQENYVQGLGMITILHYSHPRSNNIKTGISRPEYVSLTADASLIMCLGYLLSICGDPISVADSQRTYQNPSRGHHYCQVSGIYGTNPSLTYLTYLLDSRNSSRGSFRATKYSFVHIYFHGNCGTKAFITSISLSQYCRYST